MAAEAYPLQWPAGWPRTAADERRYARFHRTESRPASWNPSYRVRDKKELSIADGVARVRDALQKFGVEEHTIVISSNLELRQDGLPRSGQRAPDDPGIAVYWTDPDSGRSQCMAIDAYDTAAGNLAAVAATIEAMRAIERHGGATILNRAFQGFTALPASTTTAFNVDQAAAYLARMSGNPSAAAAITQEIELARKAYRLAAANTHPDRGGSTGNFQLTQEAKRVLEAHFGGPF